MSDAVWLAGITIACDLLAWNIRYAQEEALLEDLWHLQDVQTVEGPLANGVLAITCAPPPADVAALMQTVEALLARHAHPAPPPPCGPHEGEQDGHITSGTD